MFGLFFFRGGGGDSLEVDGMICLLFFFGQFDRLLSNDACRGFHGNMWKVEKVLMYSIICIYIYIHIYIYIRYIITASLLMVQVVTL